MYAEYLSALGVSVSEFATVEDAIAAAGLVVPHAVVTRLRQTHSRHGGIELVRWFAAQQRLQHVPVVILTTSIDPADLELATAAGCSAVVLLPSPVEHLRRSSAC